MLPLNRRRNERRLVMAIAACRAAISLRRKAAGTSTGPANTSHLNPVSASSADAPIDAKTAVRRIHSSLTDASACPR